MPVLDDLETIFSVVKAERAPKALGRGEMVALIIQNPLTFPDGTTNISEVFVGSGTNMLYFMIPGQESPYIYAEDLKDLYIRLNFPVINPNGGILDAGVNSQEPGTGYTVGDVLTLADEGSGTGQVTVDSLITGVLDGDINNAGAGYAANNLLIIAGGSINCRIRVLTVDGGGAIVTWEFENADTADRGDGYSIGTENLTGGAGAGATFDITDLTNGVDTISVTTPGTGYAEGDRSNATGGTGTGVEIVVLTVDTVLPEAANANCIIYRKRKGGHQ